MGMRIPEAYGGLELDLATYLMVLEELAWGDASVALGVAIHSGPVASLLLGHGTEDQKKQVPAQVGHGGDPGRLRPVRGRGRERREVPCYHLAKGGGASGSERDQEMGDEWWSGAA